MELSEITNSPVLWIFVIAVFVLIIFQAILFTRISRNAATDAGLTKADTSKAMRVGGISAIGPSLAISFVAIGLIAIFGTPATLMRFGLVGSVPYELLAANVAAETYGATLGGEGFDGTAWATVFLIMAMGAGVWMFVVLFFTKSMGTLSEKVKKWNPMVMTVLPAAAMLAAFSYLSLAQVKGGGIPLYVALAAGLVMAVLLFLAQKLNKSWIREWALGISMAVGIAVAAILI